MEASLGCVARHCQEERRMGRMRGRKEGKKGGRKGGRKKKFGFKLFGCKEFFSWIGGVAK
jgi:hypothetical protein